MAEILDIKKFIGTAPIQTESYLNEFIKPMLSAHRDELGIATEVKV